jgi:hypothetical protein
MPEENSEDPKRPLRKWMNILEVSKFVGQFTFWSRF